VSSTGQALVASLKTVPETRLRIIELAWELATADGTLDESKAVPRMGEIRDACQEAEDYGAATKKLARNLSECLRGP
jgi:uncharacterized tellurite resistance protein B-like protein